MRHNVYGKHLGRDKNQRQALFRGLVRNLVLQESITTTEAKSKAIKGLVDTLITRAKEGTNSAMNVLYSAIPQKIVSQKIIDEIAPRYKNRVSGFTSVIKLGPRPGDGARMVKMSLMPADVVAAAVKKEKKNVDK